jgi:Transglycosylase SLT domain
VVHLAPLSEQLDPALARPGGAPAAVAAVALLAVAALVAATAIAALGGAAAISTPQAQLAGDAAPSPLALRDIPAAYLRLYERAGARYGISWAVLAGIGRVECDDGRDPDPSCTHEGVENAAGAGGPMQFLASTWARYGVDGDGDGTADRWSPADAIYSAAGYLRAAGAPGDYRAAIFAYNHAASYVAAVQRWARRYEGAPGGAEVPAGAALQAAREAGAGADARLADETATPVRFVAGARALLAPGDGHVALVPAAAPEVVQAMVVAGNELQGLPYGPAGHPDPRGAAQEDCSSTVNYVLYRAGVRPIGEVVRANPLAQDYVGWGAPGPGRWVTIYATAAPVAHVFIVIAGLRLDTSHAGTDVGPNRDQDGPRWRILDRVPTWARWSVRHPPGL